MRLENLKLKHKKGNLLANGMIAVVTAGLVLVIGIRLFEGVADTEDLGVNETSALGNASTELSESFLDVSPLMGLILLVIVFAAVFLYLRLFNTGSGGVGR